MHWICAPLLHFLRPRAIVFPFRLLGRGSQACTYAARGLDAMEYALKVQRLNAACIQHEAAVLRQLSGVAGTPNVVGCGTLPATGGTPELSVLMTDVVGEPLSLTSGEERDTLVRRMLSLKATLTAMHRRGVFHRDLKPSHFIARGSYTFIVDFGSAFCASVPSSHPNNFRFTPLYASPRVISGAAYTAADDMTALVRCFADLLQLPEGRVAGLAGIKWL